MNRQINKSATEGFQTSVKINYLITVVSNLMAFGSSKENVERFGLTTVQLRLIGLISQMGPQTLSDASQTIHHDRSTLSRAASGLEKNGLIEKEPNRRHKNSPFLCLTAKGNELMSEVNPAYRKHAKKFTSILSKEEQSQLVLLLEKLNEHAEDIKAFE